MHMKKVVLVGGCFDVLHPGHVIFLEKAKKAGEKLVVLLESDKKVRLLKGPNRPVHTQKDRAKILKSLKYIDQVINLPFIEKESEYDRVIKKIKPNIIATTYGYPDISHYQRAAKLVGAKLKYVTNIYGHHSSSRIINWGLDKKNKS